MKKKIVLNFENILKELEEKELKICFIKGASICVQDSQGNLYDIEPYFQHSYLDKLIEDDVRVTFNLIESKETIHNIEKYGKKEIWGIAETKEFMKRQLLV